MARCVSTTLRSILFLAPFDISEHIGVLGLGEACRELHTPTRPQHINTFLTQNPTVLIELYSIRARGRAGEDSERAQTHYRVMNFIMSPA